MLNYHIATTTRIRFYYCVFKNITTIERISGFKNYSPFKNRFAFSLQNLQIRSDAASVVFAHTCFNDRLKINAP